MNRIPRRVALALAATLGPALAAPAAEPPEPRREFRAAWVATVENIDWPTRPGLPADEQKRQAIAILDRCAELNLNAVVLQVRTACDALYPSEVEPWSAVLSGVQGQAPEPAYDPLEFWIAEAHARGLQLHAWLNPFRAKPAGAKYELADSHVGKARPQLVKEYGKMLWMDPGEPAAREQTLAVVRDIARRYDVDGIHIDDYFYPYPVPGPGGQGEVPFPDDPSWERYRSQGGTLDRDDWRRKNIDDLVREMDRAMHEERPKVQFGISPFGIPRPGRPPGVVGFDQYEKLYADAEKWVREGWGDYFAPQLYWKVEAPGQPYVPLMRHWVGQNEKKRHVWPGLSVSRVGDPPRGYEPEEFVRQIELTRDEPGATGNIFFSMKVFMENRKGLNDVLLAGPLAEPALVPPSPWLDDEAPNAPAVASAAKGGKTTLTIKPPRGEPAFLWAVRVRRGDAWSTSIHPAAAVVVEIDAADEVGVAAVDRLGNASTFTPAGR